MVTFTAVGDFFPEQRVPWRHGTYLSKGSSAELKRQSTAESNDHANTFNLLDLLGMFICGGPSRVPVAKEHTGPRKRGYRIGRVVGQHVRGSARRQSGISDAVAVEIGTGRQQVSGVLW